MKEYFNLQSERLSFKALNLSVLPNWLDFFIQNDRLHFLGIDPEIPFDQTALTWIERQMQRYETDGIGQLGVYLKDRATLIGFAGLVKRELEFDTIIEITYSFKKEYWGYGYATEAALVFKNFALTNYTSTNIGSIIHPENYSSIKVAERIGLKAKEKFDFMGLPSILYRVN